MAEAAARPIRVMVISGAKHPSVNLRLLLEQNGLQVVSNRTIPDYLGSRHPLPVADIALVHVDKQGATLEGLETLLNKVQLPAVFTESAVVIGNGSVEWGRKLAAKVASAAGRSIAPRLRNVAVETAGVVRPSLSRANNEPLQSVNTSKMKAARLWVLGASLGGPDAVRRFLAKLKPMPGVGFLLAQHIGEGFAEVLAEQLSRATSLRVRCAHPGVPISEGEVVVAPVKMALDFDEDAKLTLSPRAVLPRYTPCIDDVAAAAARCYGDKCNAIIFSGMGDDGRQGCQQIADYGGQIWAQDAVSCVISSMPDAVRTAGIVGFSASPEDLAQKLDAWYTSVVSSE